MKRKISPPYYQFFVINPTFGKAWILTGMDDIFKEVVVMFM